MEWIILNQEAELIALTFLHRVQTGSEAHPASYPRGTEGKVVEAWS
jgi:hypothetical protein